MTVIKRALLAGLLGLLLAGCGPEAAPATAPTPASTEQPGAATAVPESYPASGVPTIDPYAAPK
jgi:hypothetical protein